MPGLGPSGDGVPLPAVGECLPCPCSGIPTARFRRCPVRALGARACVGQVEFANVILLNKADRMTSGEMEKLEAVVRHLNPAARVVRTVSSGVGLEEVIGTGAFDLEEASEAAGWLQVGRGRRGSNLPVAR